MMMIMENPTMIQFIAPDGSMSSISIMTTLSQKDTSFDSFIQAVTKYLRDTHSDFKLYESKQTWDSNLDMPAHVLVCGYDGLTHRFLTSYMIKIS